MELPDSCPAVHEKVPSDRDFLFKQGRASSAFAPSPCGCPALEERVQSYLGEVSREDYLGIGVGSRFSFRLTKVTSAAVTLTWSRPPSPRWEKTSTAIVIDVLPILTSDV